MAVLGINGSAATKVTNELNTYRKNYKKIDISLKKINDALKGSSSTAGFKAYVNSMNAEADKVLEFVDEYSRRLNEVVQAYKSHDNSSQQNFSAASKSLKS